MKPIKLQTTIGQTTLCQGYNGNNFVANGTFQFKGRCINYSVSVSIADDGSINRESIEANASRVEGGLIVHSTVGRDVQSSIMNAVGVVVSDYLKEHGKRLHKEYNIKKMEERIATRRKDILSTQKEISECQVELARYIRTGRLPKKNAWRYR